MACGISLLPSKSPCPRQTLVCELQLLLPIEFSRRKLTKSPLQMRQKLLQSETRSVKYNVFIVPDKEFWKNNAWNNIPKQTCRALVKSPKQKFECSASTGYVQLSVRWNKHNQTTVTKIKTMHLGSSQRKRYPKRFTFLWNTLFITHPFISIYLSGLPLGTYNSNFNLETV